MTEASGVAVIQPLPGIGDMVWHVPHLRALAAHWGTPVTLIAKPRTAAEELFVAETAVRDVLWLDRHPKYRRGRHDGPAGWLRWIAELRGRCFARAVLLHHSRSLALAIRAAAIPERYGYGFGLQRLFLNRPPFLPASAARLHPFEQASAWLGQAGIALPDAEPLLAVSATARAAVRTRLGPGREAFAVIGVGSSEPYKQWGAERFAELGAALVASGWRLVLAGGPAEAGLAETIGWRIDPEGSVVPAIGWRLSEVAALCAASSLYIGNDTGVLNLAAAVGVRSYGLFGGTPPFSHARQLVAILPSDGRLSREGAGMAGITVSAVLDAIRRDRGSLAPPSMPWS